MRRLRGLQNYTPENICIGGTPDKTPQNLDVIAKLSVMDSGLTDPLNLMLGIN
jgi:hypothetical protein